MLRVEALLGSVVAGGNERKSSSGMKLKDELAAIEPSEWGKNLSTLRRVVFLGYGDDSTAAAALHELGLRLRSPDQIAAFLDEFGSELDKALLDRLARRSTESAKPDASGDVPDLNALESNVAA